MLQSKQRPGGAAAENSEVKQPESSSTFDRSQAEIDGTITLEEALAISGRCNSVGAPPLAVAANPRRRGVLSGRVNQTPKPRLVGLDLQVDGEREGQKQTLQTVAAPERANPRRRVVQGCQVWGARQSKPRPADSLAARTSNSQNVLEADVDPCLCG